MRDSDECQLACHAEVSLEPGLVHIIVHIGE